MRTKGSTEGVLSGLRTDDQKIFGIGSSSRIGLFIHSYLTVVPSLANNLVLMAETTELFDSLLKLELLDHYERMTTKRRMSSASMHQWLIGAAFHLHVRIHQVRLKECTAMLHTFKRLFKPRLAEEQMDFDCVLRG